MVEPRGDGPSPEAEEAERGARERRRLIRKAGLYAAGLFTAALLVAVAGGAALALLFAGRLGVGFARAWISATALLIGIPLVVQGISLLLERVRRDRS
ncbi:MAG TPA: hypothetical protein VMK65_07190 [Longimicrobiales bacterium]|nr:hypothetical protein [Longimicrobiales bacterium]